MKERVILVNNDDCEIGICEKLKAHQMGWLHRCFSVFVFSSKGELLLQKRDKDKYHSGGLWSNTCCGHPRPKESTDVAAHRRLKQEMGFDCPLAEIYKFTYQTAFENGLIEHEFDHVFVGTYDGVPQVNPKEAEDWQWARPQDVSADMRKNPDKYTYWFRISLEDVVKRMNVYKNSQAPTGKNNKIFSTQKLRAEKAPQE